MKWWLPSCMLILAGLSVLILRSIAPSLAATQAVFLVIGAVVFFATQYWGLERWLRLAPLLYIGLIILLIIPLALGTTTRGIAGWIDIGNFFSVQPSQLAIPTLLLLIAPILTKFDGKNPRQLALILIFLGLPAGLIIIEPDLGTTIIYVIGLGAALWMSKLDVRYVLGMVGLGVLMSVLAWNFFLKPYQKDRINSFISPEAQDADVSYNARQALTAVGSGQLTGRGLGEGIQSHLRFLPERQTDFVFASFAEELGFLGSALVLALYSIIIASCIKVAVSSRVAVAKYIGIGTAMMFTAQAGVNIGMNMGLLPITGITLPLLSYGGSSVVAVCWLLGLVQSLWEYEPSKRRMHWG